MGRRKTYAQKISELQKPIPSQAMLLKVVPQEGGLTSLTLRIPSPRPPLPALLPLPPSTTTSAPLIPLTVSDVGKTAPPQPSRGLHLSGGMVSALSPAAQHLPQLEDLLPQEVEQKIGDLPLDLSGAKKRPGETGEEQEAKKPKLEVQEKRRLQQAEACRRYRASKRAGSRRGCSEQELQELWTFCRALLHHPGYNPQVICWETIEDGEFRIVQQEDFLQAWALAKGTRLEKDGLKRRVRGCEGEDLLHSRPHSRLGYRFGGRAQGWRPGQGELQEQGRRMVPCARTWANSRFFQEFQVATVKQETAHLFTVTPLEEVEQTSPVAVSETTVTEDSLTECEEVPCTLLLPRHRGYHAKLKVGGLTLALDRDLFLSIEQAVRQAMKDSRVTGQNRDRARAGVRKAKRIPKVGSSTVEKVKKSAEKILLSKSDMDDIEILEEESPASMPVVGDETRMETMTVQEEEEKPKEEKSGEQKPEEEKVEVRHRLPLVVAERVVEARVRQHPRTMSRLL